MTRVSRVTMTSVFLILSCFLLSLVISSAYYYTPTGHLQEGFLKEEWIPLTMKEALDYLPKQALFRVDSPMLGGCDSIRHCQSTQGALLRHKSTKPNTSSILSTVTQMLSRGMNTLVTIGDSVTEQFYADILSTLQDVLGNVYEKLPGNHTLEMPTIHRWPITNAQMKVFSSHNSKYGKLHRKRNPDGHHNEKSPGWKHYFNTIMIRPSEDTVEIHADTLDKLGNGEKLVEGLHMHGPIMIIANIGLHYNGDPNREGRIFGKQVDMYEKDLKLVLPRYVAIAKAGHLVYFRETTAQHFGPPLGGQFTYTDGPIIRFDTLERKTYLKSEYISSFSSHVQDLFLNHKNQSADDPKVLQQQVIGSDNAASFELGCIPVRTEAEYRLQGWRNRMLHEIHKQFDPSHEFVTIVPFYNATVSRHDAHHITFDCTHYCPHNRLFWDPIWTFILNDLSSKT